MRCAGCRHENRPEARFCEQCGARLAATCGACGAEGSPGARFCGQCGAAVATTEGHGGDPGAGAPAAGTAERRQVTVIFCDLVDSTALSQRIDPEEFRDLVRAYHGLCAREIGRVGGYVAQYLGDGVLGYFGYPVAHEQDAQAAVRAGLAVVDAMGRGGAVSVALEVRVGIHTGLVVAGDLGAQRELLALGSAPNVAARVQGVARPNTVVISDATRNLVGAFFTCADLGPQAMKGVPEPIRVWEVSGESGALSRFGVGGGEALTPLVGREREVAALREHWERARAGDGHVVLVAGEAGLGKSRLLQELKDTVGETNGLRLECRCAPHFEGSALYPVIDLLERVWQLRGVESADEKVARLEGALGPHLADVVPLLAAFLSIPLPSRYPPLDLTRQRQRQKTLEALVTIVSEMTATHPVLFAVEDLHWIDPSSLELLSMVAARAAGTRLLVVFLFRPTFQPPWGDAARLDLERLDERETASMIAGVAGGRALPEEVVAEVMAKADGVPLYVEELTKSMLESGILSEHEGRFELLRPLTDLAVPLTLQESLMARLDRLAPVKEIVQLGATIGRAFAYDLIRAVSSLDDATLRAELARLVEADVLHLRGTPPAVTYVFKHALIQDAAYESLLKNKRREHHRRIAKALDERFPDVAETHPELLGHHWAGAGEVDPAIVAYRRAGERAFERSAYVEADGHLRTGLGLLAALPKGVERARRELELLVALGPVLVGTMGYSNPEVEALYARARSLCDRVGDARLRYTVLSGLVLFHQSRAELAICVELTEQRLLLARELGDHALEGLVHENFGTLAYWRGDHERALVSLREARARYDTEAGRRMRLVYGTDSAVVSATYEAHVLWFLGFPDQAVATGNEAIRIARAIGQAHSLALTLFFAGGLRLFRGEPDLALPLLDEALAVSTEQQLPQWIGSSLIQSGVALANLGRVDEGIAMMFQGMGTFQATGARIGGRYVASQLADAYRRAGKSDEGLAFMDGTLPALEGCEDVFWDPEVERTRGLLLVDATNDRVRAEACLRDAVDLAQRRDGKSLVLRACVTLARHLAEDGRRAEARALLAPVYGTFTEGFETGDLRAAAALLAELEKRLVAS